jgi:hypothetical protein
MDDYGWSVLYPQVRLTTTSQRLPNQPTDPRHSKNLSLLSDFLGTLPFQVSVTSAFRSPEVNRAVGGSSTSQHTNGLGVDIKALLPGVTNKDVATYFWYYRDKIPYLDQVIYYVHKGHTHVGICPPGATGCVAGAPRKEFRKDLGSSAPHWVPTQADLDSLGARALIALGPPRDWKKLALIATGVTAGALLLGIGTVWWFSRK